MLKQQKPKSANLMKDIRPIMSRVFAFLLQEICVIIRIQELFSL